MSKPATKIPTVIHHSAQHERQDLGETIYLYAGEGPNANIMLGEIYNAEDFACLSDEEKMDETAKAIADKVVRAYNCHDLLVAALQELGDWLAYGLEKPDGAMPTEDDNRRCAKVAAKARFALDKAKGAA